MLTSYHKIPNWLYIMEILQNGKKLNIKLTQNYNIIQCY